jgi:hypothetical protein
MSLRGSGGHVDDFMFMAMAQLRLGNHDVARTWLNKAVAWIDRSTSGSVKARVTPALTKLRRDQLERYRREAEVLLQGSEN